MDGWIDKQTVELRCKLHSTRPVYNPDLIKMILKNTTNIIFWIVAAFRLYRLFLRFFLLHLRTVDAVPATSLQHLFGENTPSGLWQEDAVVRLWLHPAHPQLT